MPGDHWMSPGYAELVLAEVSAEPVKTIFTIIKVNAFPDAVRARTVYPVEISLVAFSLAQGITDVYQTIIDGERVTPGNAFNAKLLSEETGLPLPGSSHFRPRHRDYHAIAGEIVKLVKKYDLPGLRSRRILFGMSKDLEEAADAIKWLSAQVVGDQALQDSLLSIEFMDLSKLFNRIARFVHLKREAYYPATVQFNLVSVAEKQLNRAVRNNFRSEITCLYHRRVAPEFMNMCASNYCLQRAFMIFDEFLEPLGISRENGHFFSNFHLKLKPFEDVSPESSTADAKE